jgi:hypothetical protein
MKKILAFGLVFIFLTLGDSLAVPARQTVQPDTEWDYTLKYGDVQKEVRRQYIDESNVP